MIRIRHEGLQMLPDPCPPSGWYVVPGWLIGPSSRSAIMEFHGFTVTDKSTHFDLDLLEGYKILPFRKAWLFTDHAKATEFKLDCDSKRLKELHLLVSNCRSECKKANTKLAKAKKTYLDFGAY